MTLVVTDAIVLHAFDYRETSRILRLATRDAGVRSVIARGARRSKQRFGPALDLFAEGVANIALHPTGDLHTLSSFDVTRAREALAGEWARFAGANALSEIMLRFAHEEAQPELYDTYARALDALSDAPRGASAVQGLGGAWQLVAGLGFAPALDACASCDAPLGASAPVRFGHRAGGALCAKCAPQVPGARELPPAARKAIANWVDGVRVELNDDREVRAHLRLLREFLHEHLADDRALRAYAVWESNDWG